MKTVVLLIIANIWMTFAWYGHLKDRSSALWKAVIGSWLIAGLEYCFQVPANRIGSLEGWTTPQLKITQEAITLVVFSLYVTTQLNERLTWNYYVSFGLIFMAVFFAVWKW